MDRDSNSGRQKRVTSGNGSVKRRGSGLGSGGRRAGGSSSRPGSGSSPADKGLMDIFSTDTSSGSGSSSNGGSLLGGLLGGGSGNGRKKSSLLKYVLIIVVLILIFNFLRSRGFFGGSTEDSGTTESSSTSGPDLTTSDKARARYTTLKGGGKDTVTVMVYMCGTDLESEYGMATKDLQEMTSATIGDNVNVLVETGGTKKWQNSTVSNSTNQIYRIRSGGVQLVKDDLGRKSMTDPSTLSSFIQYCKTNYPADRYCLIFWDHGGGSISGYGYDQYFSGTSMTLDKINEALEDGDCKFDFIGFDACLMATFETAMITEQYADYLIASEETEPGCGWYYTDWLTALSKNTSIATVSLGKEIVESFITASKRQAPNSPLTLSVIDLAELAGTVPSAFVTFASSTNDLIENDNYAQVATARGKAKEFASSSQINQIDLIDFAQRLGTAQATRLVHALNGCVKYNRATVSNANGISIYFPYTRNTTLNSMISTYDKIGLAQEYKECIRSFASLQTGGQIISNGSGSAMGSILGNLFQSGSSSSGSSIGTDTVTSLLGGFLGSGSSNSSSGSALGTILNSFSGSSSGSSVFGSLLSSSLSGSLGSSSGSSPSGMFGSIVGNLFGSASNSSSASSSGLSSTLISGLFSSLSSDRMMQSADYYTQTYLDASRLTATPKNDGYVLKLTDEEWDLVQDVALNVFVDDGEGYIDLGLDNVYTFDEDKDLELGFDGTWLAINGQIVAYYVTDNEKTDDSYRIAGRVPVMLNGELADLILVFTDEVPYGTVLGARFLYSDGETETLAKGLTELQDGDKIDFICDFYSYAGEFQDQYYLGDPLTVDGELTISNVKLDDMPCKVTYRLTDIYNNKLWTEALDY